jgi:aminopeptidase
LSGTAERLARVAVWGANVQAGQDVAVLADVSTIELVREIVRAGYERGARFVDPWLSDTWSKRARLDRASLDTLAYVPPWFGPRGRFLEHGDGALIIVKPLFVPDILEGAAPSRLGVDQLPFHPELGDAIRSLRVNRTIIPWPTPEWAAAVHPELSPADALARLTAEIERTLRLDESDPIAAWEARFDELEAAAAHLTALRLDEVRFVGPGTDLRVGMFPGHVFKPVRWPTLNGIVHHPNLPTEEVLTVPDPRRAEGTVTATQPVEMGGILVHGLRIRFEGGAAVEIDAEENVEAIRQLADLDQGARRLGELALVDDSGRIGPLGTFFHDMLFDENTANHIALGSGIHHCVGPDLQPHVNQSGMHVDFVIGSPDQVVTGRTVEGTTIELMCAGAWCF